MMAMVQLLGNKIHIGGEIMKNTYKSFALLCMGLAAVACVEENFEPESGRIDTTPGNEIVFTASAGIEDGFKSDSKTKTVYGDKDETNKKIEINWVTSQREQFIFPFFFSFYCFCMRKWTLAELTW